MRRQNMQRWMRQQVEPEWQELLRAARAGSILRAIVSVEMLVERLNAVETANVSGMSEMYEHLADIRTLLDQSW